jgi:heme exporter protein D
MLVLSVLWLIYVICVSVLNALWRRRQRDKRELLRAAEYEQRRVAREDPGGNHESSTLF